MSDHKPGPALVEFQATDYSAYEHPEEVAEEARVVIAELIAERKKAEAEVAERDEAITYAYRLWLQRHFDDIGELLAPLSGDFASSQRKERTP